MGIFFYLFVFSCLRMEQFECCFVQADKQATDRRKLVSKWHPTTKVTLKWNYRVLPKSEERHLLKSIASLLSDDDQFRDATSH
ncbi:hypothetical protein ACSBR1_010760 [Camellia fascicularis]